MTDIAIRSYAKINWLLHVLGRRSDGYHDIETIFQSISLCDTIHIRSAGTFSFRCDDPSIPADESNLVVRAVRALEAVHPLPPLEIVLEKHIPAGGGLGGGSSNAAAVLRAIRSITGDDSDLAPIAERIGSDVAFFLVGGTALGTGRGEKLVPLPDAPPIPLLLLLPDDRVMTGEAYSLLGRGAVEPSRLHRNRAAEIASDPLAFSAVMTNDFEEPVFSRIPRLASLRERLLDAGARWARMSGSGSTLVGAFDDPDARDDALVSLSAEVRAVAASTIGRDEALEMSELG